MGFNSGFKGLRQKHKMESERGVHGEVLHFASNY